MTVDATPTPETSTPAPETPAAPETTAAPSSDTATDPAPEYTPNYKFRVKNEEKEFDEWLRPAIKSREHEEKLRDMYTRSVGLDEISASRNEVTQKFNQVVNALQQAGKMIDKGDVFDAMKILGVPESKIFQAVVKKLEYDQLPEDDKRVHDQNRRQQAQFEATQSQNDQLRKQYENAILDTRSMQLEAALSTPQVSQVAAAVNEAFSSRGVSFRDLVIREGALEHQLTGRDLSVKEAVERVIKLYDGLPLAGSVPPGSPQETVIRKTTAQTIPNLGRGGTSVPGAKVKSLADLKKLALSIRGD